LYIGSLRKNKCRTNNYEQGNSAFFNLHWVGN
jgi:hypothetical protein